MVPWWTETFRLAGLLKLVHCGVLLKSFCVLRVLESVFHGEVPAVVWRSEVCWLRAQGFRAWHTPSDP